MLNPIAASRAQVRIAAEQTIGAAAAALLWVGPDAHGVLEHVARGTAVQMVESRWSHSALESCRGLYGPNSQLAFDEGLKEIVSGSEYEPAALPTSVVPEWAKGVRRAIDDIRAAVDEETLERDDAIGRRRIVELWVRAQALLACSYWGWDTLPLNLIKDCARTVDSQIEMAVAAQLLTF